MSRKQAICYLVIGSVLILAILGLLAIYHVWLMLFAVLLITVAAGVLYKARPQLFEIFRKQKKENDASFSGSFISPKTPYAPNLILVASNLTSISQIVIDRPVFTLGRDAGCSFCIANAPDISRVHATLRYDGKTAASYIVDNNSYNGTYVNGMKLTPGKPKRISNGDFIQLGTIRFTAQIAHY